MKINIPIFVNKKYIFIGPREEQNAFCFNCYKSRLKELDLYENYFGYSEDQLSITELEILEELKDIVLNKKNEVFILEINRSDLSIKAKSTFKRGDCPECGHYNICNIIHEKDTVFDSKNLRQYNFNEVINRLEKHKKLIFTDKTSIITALTRSGDSYATPMVQTEVLFNDISMLSYGRTSKYGESKYISILESLERYATAFPYYKNKKFIEDESDLIDLTLTDVIKRSNYKNDNGYKKDIPINYEEVLALHSNKKVLIPEQLVYYNSHTISKEKRYIYDSSNGSALGSTEDEASMHAMLELFERDAFLCTWYGQIPPTKIDNDTIDSKNLQLKIQSLQRENISVHIFDISLELSIPTIWVLLEKNNPKFNEMAFFTAAAASFNLEEAIERALIESTTAITVFNNVFNKKEYLDRKKYLLQNPCDASLLEDHLLLYSNKELRNKFDFAFNTNDIVSIKDMKNRYKKFEGNFKSVVKEMEKTILKITDKAYKSVTPNPNLSNAGFSNVKYIVPGMQTMTFGHQNKRVVYDRVFKAIALKNKGTFDLDWIENNPHPFP